MSRIIVKARRLIDLTSSVELNQIQAGEKFIYIGGGGACEFLKHHTSNRIIPLSDANFSSYTPTSTTANGATHVIDFSGSPAAFALVAYKTSFTFARQVTSTKLYVTINATQYEVLNAEGSSISMAQIPVSRQVTVYFDGVTFMLYKVDVASGSAENAVFTGTKVTLPTQVIEITNNNLPNVRPIANFDFANSRSLDSRFAFTRNSNGTSYSQRGFLVTSGVNIPRFDFNPATGESLGLLREPATTNLLKYTEDFANAVWAITSTAVAANSVVSPDKNTTGSKITPINAITTFSIVQTLTSPVAGTYAVSVFAAPNGISEEIGLTVSTTEHGIQSVFFNLTTMTMVGDQGALPKTVKVVPLANGWARYTMVIALSGVSNMNAGVRGRNFVGNNVNAINLFGAMCELAEVPSSYVKSVAANGARAVDALVCQGTTFTDMFNTKEGTLLVEASLPNSSATIITGTVVGFSKVVGSSTDSVVLNMTTSSATAVQGGSQAKAANAVIYSGPGSNLNIDTPLRQGFSYSNLAMLSASNLSPAISTTLSNSLFPTMTNMYSSGGAPVHIRNITYYDRFYSAATLDALVS